MTNTERYPNCEMRGSDGNCIAISEDCTTTDKLLCRAMQASYYIGNGNGIAYWKERLEKETAKCGVSRIEKALSGKTPEEQFAFLHWLMFEYGADTSNSYIARIEWLSQ